ncbi:Fungal specific transcription factor domain [Rhizoctonia solani]|uniref:Fungal specific transcription factor domain n=1 Tax=Rhizoctonia solani TaxID=456999 RepID=A0A8H8NWW0_9AGAM|nr:Fungal specific transcription factor domain [Rhizoctonia solani]QRW20885.1 Fungal specific transcription factor domain [Rhizoctonia solani]
MAYRSRPGPIGSSCLTCKRRHKKCDLRQPVCKRCEVGRFKCEGYEHNKRGAARNARLDSSRPSEGFQGEDFSQPTSSKGRSNRETSENSLFAGERSEGTTSSSSPESFASPEMNNEREYKGPPGNTNSSALVNKRGNHIEDYLRLLISRSTSDPSINPLSIIRKIINLQGQLPYSPIDSTSPFLSYPWFVDYVLERSDRYMDEWYFRPINFPRKRTRTDMVLRLQTSPITRWVSLISMSIMEASVAGDASQHSVHSTWLGRVEGCLRRELSCDLTPRKTQERRNEWIYVAMMKSMIAHTSNTYQVLRNMTPIFLQSVFSEPKFWSKDCDPAFHISPSWIALMQWLLDSLSNRPNASSSHQWSLTSPSDFQLVLADINACRDMSHAAHDWKDIERRLLTWQSQPAEYEFTKPWMKMAWYAVQESWRLALLIYLYMAVCGTPSHDPRIQSYVHQLLQVVGTIKKQDSSNARLSLFVQYLMIGICARSEDHRKIVREKLSTCNNNKIWILRAPDFIPVLEHLWYGGTADDRPIYWIDYVLSRETMLPIEL